MAAAVLLPLVVPHGYAEAASLRVAPTSLTLTAPSAADTLTLLNEGDKPLNVQVRVFRWSQAGGVDKLEPTNEVVASPPATTLQPKQNYLLRVVRVSKKAVAKQESYRVLVDELPDSKKRRAGTVDMVLRQSLPVFFRPAEVDASDVSWSVKNTSEGLVLVARNKGGTSLRLADVKLSKGGKAVATRKGLVGYVLPGATMRWTIASRSQARGATLKLSAQSDAGPIDATVPVSGG
jgi:fimbrial chaperone protein